jgi:hypothetical protein
VTRHASGSRRSRRGAEDRSRAADVGVHAGLGDPEKARDLFRRKTARHRAQHLTLTIGQPGDGPRAPVEDAAGDEIPGEDPDHR